MNDFRIAAMSFLLYRRIYKLPPDGKALFAAD